MVKGSFISPLTYTLDQLTVFTYVFRSPLLLELLLLLTCSELLGLLLLLWMPYYPCCWLFVFWKPGRVMHLVVLMWCACTLLQRRGGMQFASGGWWVSRYITTIHFPRTVCKSTCVFMFFYFFAFSGLFGLVSTVSILRGFPAYFSRSSPWPFVAFTFT